MKEYNNIIYLLGAGRSGTTLMATVLNSHPNIKTIGEMHQFFEHLKEGKFCSCGLSLEECEFWNTVLSQLKLDAKTINEHYKTTTIKEGHRNILKLLLTKQIDKGYLETQIPVFEAIANQTEKAWLLDSSKYIARYLLLRQSNELKVKGIYVVRDLRGVINSFGKQVQTPKSPVATIFYYALINCFGQLVCWLDKNVMKVRYEDFVSNPEQTLARIYKHVFEKREGVVLPSNYEMPHIIGGNRMKANKTITIKNDVKWKALISRPKQIAYYIVLAPMMLLNRYKI